ncbi:MAG: HAD hydrolase-like protein [Calditrichia bacterium]
MIKTVIFKLEGVILSQDLLLFKYYQILWSYLRVQPEWKDFSQLIKLRNLLMQRNGESEIYLNIARRYLSQPDFERYQLEIKLFRQKHSASYLHIIPGIRSIIQSTSYYYKNALFTHQKALLKLVRKDYKLNNLFSFIIPPDMVRDMEYDAGFFQKILEQTRSNPSETVMVSDRSDAEMSSAQKLGIYTISANFDITTRGISPQSSDEREYFTLPEKRISHQPSLLIRRVTAHAVAKKPRDILLIIEALEAGEKPPRQEEQPQAEKQYTLADLLREAFAPQFKNDRKSD